MNFRYNTDFDTPLKTIIARNPTANLHEIRSSHPLLRSMSLDSLAIRVSQLNVARHIASLK